MKKLFTVSVLAIMAVSTANAEIASTGITGKADFQGTNYLDATADLTAAAVALDSNVKTNAGAIEALDGRMDTAEGKITTLEGTVGGHTESITELGTTVEQIKQGTGVNKATKTAAGIVQVGDNINVDASGVISVDSATTEKAGIVTLANDYADTDTTKAVTGKVVAKAISDSATEVNVRINAVEATANAALPTATFNTQIANYSTTEQMNTAIGTAAGQAVSDANAETTRQVNALSTGQVATNKTNIEALQQTANSLSTTYETKTDAAAKLTEAKNFTTAEIEKIINATEFEDGTHALTLKVVEGKKTLGWELIGR